MNKFIELFNGNWDGLIIGIIAGVTLSVMLNHEYALWKRATIAFLAGLLMILIYIIIQFIDLNLRV